mgnify:CR=1 FL=1
MPRVEPSPASAPSCPQDMYGTKLPPGNQAPNPHLSPASGIRLVSGRQHFFFSVYHFSGGSCVAQWWEGPRSMCANCGLVSSWGGPYPVAGGAASGTLAARCLGSRGDTRPACPHTSSPLQGEGGGEGGSAGAGPALNPPPAPSLPGRGYACCPLAGRGKAGAPSDREGPGCLRPPWQRGQQAELVAAPGVGGLVRQFRHDDAGESGHAPILPLCRRCPALGPGFWGRKMARWAGLAATSWRPSPPPPLSPRPPLGRRGERGKIGVGGPL